MRDEDVPAQELDRARRYVALRLPQRFETAGDLTRRLSEATLYELPADYWSTYVPRVMSVDAADVRRAAWEHLDPDRMAVVVVGDRAAVEAPLRALGRPLVHVPSDLETR